MTTYTTKQGDMWDLISYNLFESTNAIIPLMQANPEHSETFIFPAGVELNVPDFDEILEPEVVPPWMEEDEDES